MLLHELTEYTSIMMRWIQLITETDRDNLKMSSALMIEAILTKFDYVITNSHDSADIFTIGVGLLMVRTLLGSRSNLVSN